MIVTVPSVAFKFLGMKTYRIIAREYRNVVYVRSNLLTVSPRNTKIDFIIVLQSAEGSRTSRILIHGADAYVQPYFIGCISTSRVNRTRSCARCKSHLICSRRAPARRVVSIVPSPAIHLTYRNRMFPTHTRKHSNLVTPGAR